MDRSPASPAPPASSGTAAPPPDDGFHYGWVVVAAGALAGCAGFGAVFSLPVFLAPIAQATGWSRTGISAAMTIGFVVMGLAAFAWGALSDRVGPRPVLLAGAVLLGTGLGWAGRAETLWEFQLAWGVVVGVAAGTLMAPTIAAVSLWFDRHRALAISLVTVGVGVAPMTVAPLAAWLEGRWGWREALLAIAAGAAALVLLAAWLVRPPARPLDAAAGEVPATQAASVRQALLSRPFAVLAATFFLCCAAHSGPIFHTVSYAIGCGLAPMAAVAIYGVEGLAGLGGRVLWGVAADRLGVLRVLVAGLLVQALAAGAYAAVRTEGGFYAVAAVFGLAYGGVMPLYAALVRIAFDPRMMGTVLGALTMVSSIGMALGPAFGGWVYDRSGTYAWLYGGSLALGLAAAAVALAFRPAAAGAALREAPAGL